MYQTSKKKKIFDQGESPNKQLNFLSNQLMTPQMVNPPQRISPQKDISQQKVNLSSQQVQFENEQNPKQEKSVSHKQLIFEKQEESKLLGHTNPMNEIIQQLPPGNIEYLMTLFQIQKPLNLNSSVYQSNSAKMSTLNQQIANYSSNYYHQLDIEGERVRERLKEKAKAVEYIIQKYKSVESNHHKMEQKLNEYERQIELYQENHKVKLFQQEVKYKIQQFESKIDELQDFYLEVYNLMVIFMLALQEQKQSNILEHSVHQQKGQRQGQGVNKTLDVSNHEYIEELELNVKQVKEIEVINKALKLYQQLQNHSKSIELILSEIRRLQYVSQDNEEFKSLSHQLMSKLQKYPEFQQDSIEQLRQLFHVNSLYLTKKTSTIKDQLLLYNATMNEFRNSFASVEKFLYLKKRCQKYDADNYFKKLEIIYLNLPVDPSSIPEPSQGASSSELKELEKSLKSAYRNSQEHKYFTFLRNKVFKHCLGKMKETKESSMQHERQQQQAYKDLIKSLQQNSELEMAQQECQVHIGTLQKKIKKECIGELQLVFEKVKRIEQSCIETLEMSNGEDSNPHFKSFLHTQTQKCAQIYRCIQPFLEMGDIDAILEFQQLNQKFYVEFEDLAQFFDEFLSEIDQKIQDSNDVDNIVYDQIKLKRKILTLKNLQLDALLGRQINQKFISSIELLQMRQQQVLQLSSTIDAFLDCLSYLTLNNLRSISNEFNENDSQTEVAQMEELIVKECTLKVNRLLAQKMAWVQQDSHVIFDIILNNHAGFVWLEQFFVTLSKYQRNLQKLMVMCRSLDQQHSLQQQQQQLIQSAQSSQNDSLQQQKSGAPITIHDFLHFLEQNKFHTFYQLNNQLNPSTQRWKLYQEILANELGKIYQVYFEKIVNRIDVIGNGLIQSGQMDGRKCEIILNYLRRVNKDGVNENAKKIVQGQMVSKDQQELLEFSLVIQQIYVKILKLKSMKSDDAGFESNIKELFAIFGEFFDGIVKVYEELTPQSYEINKQVHDQKGLICLILSNIANIVERVNDSLINFLKFQSYVYLQLEWIWSFYYAHLEKELDVFEESTSKVVNQLAFIQSFEYLRDTQIAKYLEGQYDKVEIQGYCEQIQECLVSEFKFYVQELDGYQRLCQAIAEYKGLVTGVDTLIASLSDANKYKELQGHSQVQPNSSKGIPVTIHQQIEYYVGRYLRVVDGLLGRIDRTREDSVQVSVMSLSLKTLREREMEMTNWAVCFWKVLKHLGSKVDYLKRDYENTEFAFTEQQSTLLVEADKLTR